MHKLKSLPIALLTALAALPASGQNAQELYNGFIHPDQSSRPRVWWHWMNGNITKDGIRKDLQWMKQSGIVGFHVFDAGLETPQIVEKRLEYMTPAWKDAFRYAIQLADSLGMEATIASSPGWSETGGPWVKDEDGMKKLVWRQVDVVGGKTLKIQLPEGFTQTGPFQDYNYVQSTVSSAYLSKKFYRDIAVLAMRLPDADRTLRELNPVLTVSGGTATLNQLDNDSISDYAQILPDASGKTWLLFDFGKPQTIKSLSWSIVKTVGGNENYEVEVLASDDAQNFKKVGSFGYQGGVVRSGFIAETKARYFRVNLKATDKGNPACPFMVSMLSLSPVYRVNCVSDKAGFGLYRYGTSTPIPSSTDVIRVEDVVNITQYVKDGLLTWKAPAGRWRIMRFGYGLTGKTNHPASPEATGLEVDKMDPVAIRNYYKDYVQTYIDATDGMVGKRGITYMLNDSYEAGGQTWTGKMREEFMKRRGYDVLPWLPAVAGVVINSSEETERFLFDWRMVQGEMMTEYHYDMPGEMMKEYGLKRYVESHEAARANMTDGMDCKRYADIPMSAIWMRYKQKHISEPQFESDIRESASVAHIFGQNIAAAESFTTDGDRDGAFVYSPSVLKPTADKAMACGLNRFVIHTSPHQPVDNKFPGLGLGKWGQWFDRHETWAGMANHWTDYLSRSCFLLQQGKFVADVAFFYGEGTNITARYQTKMPKFPKGYNYDFVNPTILCDVLQVDNGELTTKTGMRYKVLWLDNVTAMSMKVLRRLKQLADAGVTIAGGKPQRLAGMEGTPEEFSQLVNSIWGTNRTNVTVNVPLEKVLAAKGVKADVDFGNIKSDMGFVHRALDNGDVFWVANHSNQSVQTPLCFRVTGKRPQVWHADTGIKEDVSYTMEADGRTTVMLDLVPYDAQFVMFIEDTDERQAAVAAPVYEKWTEVATPWTVKFQENRGAPSEITMNTLTSLATSDVPGVKYFSGVATYQNTFMVDKKLLKKKVMPKRIWLDLGTVNDLAEVWVNGKFVACVWKTPYKVDITAAVQAGANRVEVKVANTWHNRLVGDEQPGTERVAYYPVKFYTADELLMPAGLQGPVTVIGEK